MKLLHRQFLSLAALTLAAGLKQHVGDDAAEAHEDNTFDLPNGNPIAKYLKTLFRGQLKVVLGTLPKPGAEIPEKFASLADYTDPMASALTPVLSAYWSTAGKGLAGRLGLDPAEWRVTDPHLHKLIAAQALDFCAATNATTDKDLATAHAQLREELHAGLVSEGEAIPELVARVQKVFERASTTRAVAIARTEAARAVHGAALASAVASGVVAGKRWLVSANSCALCHKLAADVGTVALDQPFGTVGHSETYKTVRTPPAHPHCRCSMVFTLTDADAEPVPAWVHEPIKVAPAPKPKKKPPAVAPAPPAAAEVATPAPVAVPPPAPPVGDPPAAPAVPAPATAWPSDPNNLRVVRQLGGSTGAELVEDADGNRFVRKRGDNPGHLRSEDLADRTYRAFGVAVPDSKLFETDDGPVKLARFVEGKTLGELQKTDPAAARKAEAKLREHFALDALIGNWDVIGMAGDNVLITPDGTPYRIDNGGSLDYRAQGEKKTPAQWSEHPTDLWSMRDAKLNPSAAHVFGSVGYDDWSAQVLALARADVDWPDDAPTRLRERLGQATDLVEIAHELRTDRFGASYCDDFAKHTAGIRVAGITAKMPTLMERNDGDKDPDRVMVFDQDGRPYDHLRGQGSLAVELDTYIRSQGGSPNVVSTWKKDQGGDSWRDGPQALKVFLQRERGMDPSELWWKEGVEVAQKHYEAMVATWGEIPFRTGMIAHHAYTRELLAKADFENKRGDKVQLVRTEAAKVMKHYGLKVGDRGCLIQRGMAESCSIYRRVKVFGTQTTVQHVPLHRIVGTYWQARSGIDASPSFLGDNENEFVALLDGLPFDYVKEMPRKWVDIGPAVDRPRTEAPPKRGKTK